MAGERFDLSVKSLGPVGAAWRLLQYTGTFLGNAVVHPLSRLLRRNPKQLAFGAPSGRFEGNAKYLFLWMSRNGDAEHLAWITEDADLVATLRGRGFRAFYRWSLAGLSWAGRAGIFVVNDNASDVNFIFSGGARVFNLWHGIGLKNVNRGAKVGYGAQLRRLSRNPIARIRNMRRFQKPTWILATSKHTAVHFFARCFELPEAQAPALGYPRLDPLINSELRDLGLSFDERAARLGSSLSARSLLYVPTLRVRDDNLLATAIPNVTRLSEALATQEATLYLKLHPKTQRQSGWAGSLPANIRMIPDDLDIYPLLGSFSGLITDYSSLYFDYLALHPSGITLYPFDFDKYITVDRDLAWNYDAVSVGTRVDTFNELCRAIIDGRVFARADPDRLSALRQQFWDGELGTQTACERISTYLTRVRANT